MSDAVCQNHVAQMEFSKQQNANDNVLHVAASQLSVVVVSLPPVLVKLQLDWKLSHTVWAQNVERSRLFCVYLENQCCEMANLLIGSR